MFQIISIQGSKSQLKREFMSYLRNKLTEHFKLGFINEDQSIEVEGFLISTTSGMDLMDVLSKISVRFLINVYLTELLIKPSIKILVASSQADFNNASRIKPAYMVGRETSFDVIFKSLMERELRPLRRAMVMLEVHGKIVPLNPFVESVFKSVVKALMSVLKGVEDREAILSIKE